MEAPSIPYGVFQVSRIILSLWLPSSGLLRSGDFTEYFIILHRRIQNPVKHLRWIFLR